MTDLSQLSLKELVDRYNQITGKNIKKFESKAYAIKKLQEVETMTEPKTYTPKQLEVILNTNQMVIRKKLRKMFPDQAKKGAWKITEDMLEVLKNDNR